MAVVTVYIGVDLGIGAAGLSTAIRGLNGGTVFVSLVKCSCLVHLPLQISGCTFPSCLHVFAEKHVSIILMIVCLVELVHAFG